MKIKLATFEIEGETLEDIHALLAIVQSLQGTAPIKPLPNASKDGPFERFCKAKYKGNGGKMPFRFGSTSLKEYGSRENFFSAQLSEEERILAESVPCENEGGEGEGATYAGPLERGETDEGDY
jgi:hypothetical protein